ncbi:MAG: DUF1501 domain-containing protein [Planctomycetes bacterium]|nr:DUF1501 domain-containing protein [Planctomycetota bacterium]MBL7044791.1 DUF1501 domain-containing protein [Pirellulaceae bacterium]
MAVYLKLEHADVSSVRHGGSGNNFMSLASGMQMLGGPLDKAISAFLSDLEERGLLENVLLVITGEFGRTPKINKNAGRDHWGSLSTLALAGGGLDSGQVLGQAARNNDVPHSDPVGVENLMSTIMNILFDVGPTNATERLGDFAAQSRPKRATRRVEERNSAPKSLLTRDCL